MEVRRRIRESMIADNITTIARKDLTLAKDIANSLKDREAKILAFLNLYSFSGDSEFLILAKEFAESDDDLLRIVEVADEKFAKDVAYSIKDNYKKNLAFTPRLIDFTADSLTIELIEGKTLGEIDNPDPRKLAHLFSKLHSLEDKTRTICLVDTNPRNILIENDTDRYFFIDFSDWKVDYPESDLVNFLLFLASMQNIKKFQKFCKTFLKTYILYLPINHLLFSSLIPQKIVIFDQRRVKYGKIEKNLKSKQEINRKYLFKIPKFLLYL